METERLILRRWKADDFEPFAALNNDPTVMEFFPALLTPGQSRDMIAMIEDHFQREGFGLWALEVKGTAEFAGFVGLNKPTFKTNFTPCVEIGWRLAHRFWGKGYAPEAARAVLKAGFEVFELDEIVSFTAAVNHRSIRVMEKIGMASDPAENFNHPRLADGHPLQLHVLYRKMSPSNIISGQVEHTP